VNANRARNRTRAAWLAFALAFGACVVAVGIATGAAIRSASSTPTAQRDASADSISPGLLVVEQGPSGDKGTARQGRRDDDDRAMALAIASLSPSERTRIVNELRYVTARLEARLSPLAIDLDDGDPVDSLRRSMSAYAPSYAAAFSFDRDTWTLADLTVRVVASCDRAHLDDGASCISLWGKHDTKQNVAERARFAAWPVAHAAVVELNSSSSTEQAAGRLRERTSLQQSTIALVLMDRDLALEPVAERPELEAAAKRLGAVIAANHIDQPEHFESLGHTQPSARPSERVAPWLRVSPNAIVVVPRLSALAKLDSFGIEIEQAIRDGSARWIHRPAR